MYTWILVFFTVFLKNWNIISKIKKSKVTDYAALKWRSQESSIEIRAQKSYPTPYNVHTRIYFSTNVKEFY